MKLRGLHLILFACLLPGLTVMSGTAYSQAQEAITESNVNELLNGVDRASRKGNIAGIIAPLAKDIRIKMTVSSPVSAKEQVLNLSKDQYEINIRQVFRQRLAYQLERKNTRIKIYNDNKTAMVTSDVYETLKLRQGVLRAVSSEVSILNLRNGKIVVTSIEARTRFY